MGSLASLHILVVEDNDSVRKAVAYLLKKAGYDVISVSSGFAALDKLQQHYFDLVISDYKMENMDGIELLAKIKNKWPATEVIIITAFGSIARGVEAIKLGAFDYLTKPFDNEELLGIVARFVEKRKTGKKLDELSVRLRNQSVFDPIIGNSEKIFYLLDIVNRIAAKESTILIKGESGTGKELIAKSIHALSARKDKPFVAINCGAIPESIQESELFGHVKGAFTGAENDKKGIFEQADGGTVFLDEIGEMASSTQVKLLRALQENEIRRVGDDSTRKVNIRLIVATNKNIDDEVKSGNFREDLYYRINVIPINVPALRERKEDIPFLVNHFIRKYGFQNQSPVKRISKRAGSMLMNYDWPGNVRELENVIHRCVALTSSEEITPELLPKEIQNRSDNNNSETSRKKGNLAEIEKAIILETLERMSGNKLKTAKELGISKSTLWRKLKDSD